MINETTIHQNLNEADIKQLQFFLKNSLQMRNRLQIPYFLLNLKNTK